MIRIIVHALSVLVALLAAAGAEAHQDTVAHSRMVIRASGEVEYALKIPVEDLAESLGRGGHTALNAPEVRAAEELLFRHFLPLVNMSAGGAPCPVERRGIDVPEDERLYGELRFAFRCPPGVPVALDYRVFFDVDPGHMGMLEVEGPGGTARAELILERPRWEVDARAAGPPQVRPVAGQTASPPAAPPPAAPPIAPPPAPPSEQPQHASRPEAPPASPSEQRPRPPGRGNWVLIALVIVVAAAGAVQALRMKRRR